MISLLSTVNVYDVSSGRAFGLTANRFLFVLPADDFMGKSVELVKPSIPELPPQAMPQDLNDPVRNDLPEHLRVC